MNSKINRAIDYLKDQDYLYMLTNEQREIVELSSITIRKAENDAISVFHDIDNAISFLEEGGAKESLSLLEVKITINDEDCPSMPFHMEGVSTYQE